MHQQERLLQDVRRIRVAGQPARESIDPVLIACDQRLERASSPAAARAASVSSLSLERGTSSSRHR